MMKKTAFTFMFLLLAGSMETFAQQTVLSLASPDGKNTITFSKAGKELQYELKTDGECVVLPSRAGLELETAYGKWHSASAPLRSPTAGWTCWWPTV